MMDLNKLKEIKTQIEEIDVLIASTKRLMMYNSDTQILLDLLVDKKRQLVDEMIRVSQEVPIPISPIDKEEMMDKKYLSWVGGYLMGIAFLSLIIFILVIFRLITITINV